jgi:hypothetical protein
VYASIETLAALRELGMPLSYRVVLAVALSGRLSILQQLLSEQQCPKPSTLSHNAARSGSISMLKWLRSQSWCTFDESTCAGAAKGGQLAALKHLRSEGCDWDAEQIARDAAGSGSIEVVEWLRQQQGVQIGAAAMGAAAHAGHIAMCEHLHSTGVEWNALACYRAAAGGHLDAVRWLQEQGCPWDVTDVCIGAARAGATAILDCVLEQGEVLDAELLTDALDHAAVFDHLQAAQWLRAHGAEWPPVLGWGKGEQWSDAVVAWARAEGL